MTGAATDLDAPAATPRLTSRNVCAYLRARGLIPSGSQTRVSELSGGISNTVLRVDCDGRTVVVKQALAQLRVATRWDFDPRRTLVEAECMLALNSLLRPGSVPEVLDLDRSALTFTMSHAPAGGRVWKDELLAGRADPDTAARAGALLGEIHLLAAGTPGLSGRFSDLMPLMQGRIEPYHRTAAATNPDLTERIERDVARLTSNRRTLVLGDYSPKNLLVYPDRLLALDFEVAHWGDPSFDTAFLLTHLLAKAIHLPDHAPALLRCASRFWTSYVTHAGDGGATESDTAAELAVLLLCRVDGKSRLEYLTHAQRRQVRELARHLLRSETETLGRVFDAVAQGC